MSSAISSQKSNKQKPRAAQQFSAAPSKATGGDGGPKEDQSLSKVQQKLAARMIDLPPEDVEFSSWQQLKNTVGDVEGRGPQGKQGTTKGFVWASTC